MAYTTQEIKDYLKTKYSLVEDDIDYTTGLFAFEYFEEAATLSEAHDCNSWEQVESKLWIFIEKAKDARNVRLAEAKTTDARFTYVGAIALIVGAVIGFLIATYIFT